MYLFLVDFEFPIVMAERKVKMWTGIKYGLIQYLAFFIGNFSIKISKLNFSNFQFSFGYLKKSTIFSSKAEFSCPLPKSIRFERQNADDPICLSYFFTLQIFYFYRKLKILFYSILSCRMSEAYKHRSGKLCLKGEERKKSKKSKKEKKEKKAKKRKHEDHSEKADEEDHGGWYQV